MSLLPSIVASSTRPRYAGTHTPNRGAARIKSHAPLHTMRRKVIQHFANMFPQRFLDLPEGFDLAVLAREKSGIVEFDFLRGIASIGDVPKPEMRTGASYREWLLRESAAHGIPAEALLHASMKVAFNVSGIEVKESDGHVFHSATFSFHCTRALRTDEKSCIGRSSGSKAWNYGYYWALLYGDEPRT